MTVSTLNQGQFETGPLAPSDGLLKTPTSAGERLGREATVYNDDTVSYCTVKYGKAGEAIDAGAMCVWAEDYVATEVDPGDIGQCGVAVTDMASGDYGWFFVAGQVRVQSESTAAGTSAYISASNAGFIDDAVVAGDRIHGVTIVEAEVTTSGAYNENTSKCMLDRPYVGSDAPIDGITATAAEINQAADISVNTEIVTGANVITAAESGATFILNAATGFASTLPAVAAGLRFTFIVGATAPSSGNHTIVPNASNDNTIFGSYQVAGAEVPADAEGSINIVASTALPGDIIHVFCDGTNWYVSGMAAATGAVTFTT